MAKFLTRVELHGVKPSDGSYDTLHAAMEEAGFKRTFPLNDTIRTLPSAQYFCQGDYTSKIVYDVAATAAKKTGKKFWILAAKIEAYTSNCPIVA